MRPPVYSARETLPRCKALPLHSVVGVPLRACLVCSAAMLAIPATGAAAPSMYAPCAPGTPAPPTTGTAIFTASIGADGKGGSSSSFEGPGHAGDPGQAGGNLSYAAAWALSAVSLFSMGGAGGEGSNAGSGRALAAAEELVRLLATDKETSGGQVVSAGSFQYYFAFGTGGCGVTNCGGNGAPVSVTHTGSITTAGDNAYGILAQSTGGGGGAVLGGVPVGSNLFAGSLNSDANQTTGVQVSVGNNAGPAGSASNITTTGSGAVAILAQSIGGGGGGGLAGDTGLTAQRQAFSTSAKNNGNAGPVLIQVGETATLSTCELNTPVILAQSIGGGGGRVTNNYPRGGRAARLRGRGRGLLHNQRLERPGRIPIRACRQRHVHRDRAPARRRCKATGRPGPVHPAWCGSQAHLRRRARPRIRLAIAHRPAGLRVLMRAQSRPQTTAGRHV